MSKYFFCAIAGSGMSALAQILKMEGHEVCGSDRSFDNNQNLDIKEKFEKNGIKTYPQNGIGITKDIDFFVISTAVEETNPEYEKAKKLGLKIIHRSEVLSEYVSRYQTIAVAGTSGKSTTTAMIWHILNESGLNPSVINGAYINSIMNEKFLGNAYGGKGKWLVIEADESDSTITRYKPKIGLILNITKDHKPIEELKKIFSIFISNSETSFINEEDDNCKEIAAKNKNIRLFGKETLNAQIIKTDIFHSQFKIADIDFHLPIGGLHNIENAIAAISVTKHLGLSLKDISKSLLSFKGTFRRMNLVGEVNGIKIIDDYAHNPAKIEAAVKTVIGACKRAIFIYQPHGYAPARMFKNDLVEVFSKLRKEDILIMPEIYYAGGSVTRDISSKDIIDETIKKGVKAFYFPNRQDIKTFISENIKKDDIIMVMGARDNSLNLFAKEIHRILYEKNLKAINK
ncbi:MAG TPA: Mur ligase family protein [Elusimicrobiales bacterium]|nr:Mur ligase family protein [Elusimicrobiales bacterium]